ncbi:MAG: metallophosphoesterase family protein [Tepidiformaceae bacterium]|tara:strand:- start:333 stop:923 length:591 start_codon:yes stop_codon:yes gene_type:complete
MRVGVIADTHLPSLIRSMDELSSDTGEFLTTVELILHAGDVTAPSVLDWCEQFAPIYVARGNNDIFDHPSLAEGHLLEIEGWRIGLTHELRPESRPISVLRDQCFPGEEIDILIAGDTHVERLECREGVVFLNPGSPTLPHHKEMRLGTVGLLDLTPKTLHAEIVVLGETPGSPNPGVSQELIIEKGWLEKEKDNV